MPVGARSRVSCCVLVLVDQSTEDVAAQLIEALPADRPEGKCGRNRIRTCVGNAGDFTGRSAVTPRVPRHPTWSRSPLVTCTNDLPTASAVTRRPCPYRPDPRGRAAAAALDERGDHVVILGRRAEVLEQLDQRQGLRSPFSALMPRRWSSRRSPMACLSRQPSMRQTS
jgi:hypothetical protein